MKYAVYRLKTSFLFHSFMGLTVYPKSKRNYLEGIAYISLSGLIPPLTVELARLCKTHCNIYFCRFKENFHEQINLY